MLTFCDGGQWRNNTPASPCGKGDPVRDCGIKNSFFLPVKQRVCNKSFVQVRHMCGNTFRHNKKCKKISSNLAPSRD